MINANELVAPPDTPELDEARRHGRSISLWLAAGWIAAVTFCGVFGSLLPLPDADAPLAGEPRSGPSWNNLLGTDTVGHDLLSQIVAGSRTSLLVASTSVVTGLLIGGLIGITAGYLRGPVDATIVWSTDVLFAFPGLVLTLAIVSFAGASLISVVVAINVVAIPAYARLARASTLSVAPQDFVLAAETLGASSWRILRREIAPNVGVQLLAFSTLGAAIAIVAEGGLSFLGLGAPDSISWGTMIAEGQNQLRDAPQAAIVPVLAMFLTILALNHLGEVIGARNDTRASQIA